MEMLKWLVPLVAMISFPYVEFERIGMKPFVELSFLCVNAAAYGILLLVHRQIGLKVPKEGKIRVPAVIRFGKEVQAATTKTPYEIEMGRATELMQKVLLGFILPMMAYYSMRATHVMASSVIIVLINIWEPL